MYIYIYMCVCIRCRAKTGPRFGCFCVKIGPRVVLKTGSRLFPFSLPS